MKKCSHCKSIIDDDFIKCPKCKKYVDNDVFNRLSKEDVEKIIKNDLSIYTPTLLALEMKTMYPDDMFSDIKKKYQDQDIQYNYFLFTNYIFYKCSVLRINIKKESLREIIDEYKQLIISLSANYFIEREEIKYSYDYLINQAYKIFEQLDNAMLMESPSITGKKFAKIIFGKSDVLLGFELHLRLTTYFNTVDTFSSMFLVEEDDWDWEKLLDES